MKINQVTIRKFTLEDIPDKINWINDPLNNRYLHYDLPLIFDKTVLWYQKIKENDERYDGVVEYEGVPVGLIGLLNIDKRNRKAESYIIIGRHEYKGKGIGYKAEQLILDYAFNSQKLNKVYAFIEAGNQASLLLHQKAGYIIEGCLKQDVYMPKKGWVDRYIVSIISEPVNKEISYADANSAISFK